MLRHEDISQAGKQVDTIPVSIGYRIIELFSGQLYSNPAKAIEELVVNSYDAFATHCQVVVPSDWDEKEAQILVWDDGDSMDLDGLKALWLIADTIKRDAGYTRRAAQRHRLPVGKFGIGKLASYVVGKRITHICKTNKILAVTMDYSEVIPQQEVPHGKGAEIREIGLKVRELSEREARQLLGFATSGGLPGGVSLPLFGSNAPPSWTLVVVDRLKEDARRITTGRLKWIISTALPLAPDFEVSLNGEPVPASKLNYPVLKKWQIGKDDSPAKDLGYETGTDHKKKEPFDTWIVIPRVGKISGEFVLYEDSLLGGKAAEAGRSHGFFLMVRHRLINHDDPLLGVHVLSHATFNRMHTVIYADDLDSELVASRESISEDARNALQRYLLAKFQEVRSSFERQMSEKAKKEDVAERLAVVPGQLMQFPLIHALDRAKSEGRLSLRSIQLPEKAGKVKEGINRVEFAPLDPTLPLAVFDATLGVVKVNSNHPFYVNFYDSSNMEAVAIAEVMLEAYLLESNLTTSEISAVVDKRDQLLRALVREEPRSVMVLARQMRESVGDSIEMREACYRAFRALGFEVVAMKGGNEPSGLASAPLAVKYGKELGQVEEGSYKVVYLAEDSKLDSLSLATAARKLAKVVRKYGAKYTAVVASEFDSDSSQAVGDQKSSVDVCQIRMKDFASLVEASGTKPLPLSKLEGLFRDCRTVGETHDWVQRFVSSTESLPELREVLERAFALQQSNRADPPSIGAIKYYRKTLAASERELNEWLTALSRLLPGLIYVYGDKVELHQTPEIIVKQFQQSLQQIGKSRKAN